MFVAHKEATGGFEQIPTNKLFTEPAMITSIEEKLWKSGKGSSFVVYVTVKAEIAGKSPFEGRTNYLFYNAKIEPNLYDNFIKPMGLKETIKNGQKGYNIGELENKRCMTIIYDDYYVSKPNIEGKKFVNSYPKIFACVPVDYDSGEIDILVRDAENYSLKTRQTAEAELQRTPSPEENTSMGDVLHSSDDKNSYEFETDTPF